MLIQIWKERYVKQITIRGFDKEVESELRELAAREEISLNRAALRLLRRGAGVGGTESGHNLIGSSLEHLSGTWSEEAQLVASVEGDFERIDLELWS